MLPALLAGTAGSLGAKMIGGALSNDDEEAKKAAMMKLHQNYANGQLSSGMAPPQESGPNMMGAVADAGKSLVGGLLADKKPGEEEVPWYKAAARGALGGR